MVGSVIDNPYRVKAGTILSWPNVTIPVGWLVCDGSAVSRTTYKALFDVIGETYGIGDGSTTFNLPNGKIPVGNAQIKGNGMVLGLTDGSTNYGVRTLGSGTNYAMAPHSSYYGQSVATSGAGSAQEVNGAKLGITTNGSKSGMIADSTNTTCETKTLIKY